MKKQHIFYLITGIVALILIAGGWYVYKFRGCVGKVSYVPPREGKNAGDGFYGAYNSIDKGNYYLFFSGKFKTSKDAMRACIWK